MGFLTEFPTLSREALREISKVIDTGFSRFSGQYGNQLEQWFDPLLQFMLGLERLLLATPWPISLTVMGLLAWWSSRSWKMVAGTLLTLMAIGYLGMWGDTMRTISMITVSTLLAVLIGLPLGVLMARSNRIQSVLNPLLDVMQTLPSFVYLIPVVMLLGIGRVPGVIAVVIYALPPMIRLTNLGIRQVDHSLLEAAMAFGASPWQLLRYVQLPLALPTIFAGINQTIMMALAMVVVASMIGVQGLGQPVLKAITNQYFAMGLLNGAAIVALAIIFDRLTQRFGQRLQAPKATH